MTSRPCGSLPCSGRTCCPDRDPFRMHTPCSDLLLLGYFDASLPGTNRVSAPNKVGLRMRTPRRSEAPVLEQEAARLKASPGAATGTVAAAAIMMRPFTISGAATRHSSPRSFLGYGVSAAHRVSSPSEPRGERAIECGGGSDAPAATAATTTRSARRSLPLWV